MVTPVSNPSLPPASPAPRPRRFRRRAVVLTVTGAAAVTGLIWTCGLAPPFNHLAARALAERDPDRAARWLDWSQRVAPNDSRAEFLRARVARRRQDYERVREHLLRAFQLGSPRELLEREQALVSAQAGQLREAEPHLSRLLTDPRDDGAEICEAYVTGYLQVYQTGRAHRLLDAWEQDFPRDPMPHVIRARLHVDSENWNAAERSLRQALALDPDDSETAVSLGEVLAALKKYEQALEWFKKGEGDSRRNPEARLGVAKCLQALGRLEEARLKLTALAEEYPASAPVLYALGQAELEGRRAGRARELLERARQLDPRNPEILQALAGVLRRAGETAAADGLVREGRRLVEARSRIERLVEQIAVHPDDVAARYEVATLQLQHGSEREGVLWLKSVLHYEPDHAGAREALERCGKADTRARNDR